MEYPYFVVPATGGKKIYKPFIRVILHNKKSHKYTPQTIALIDSGADICMCNDSIAAWLGINTDKIKDEKVFTAANGSKFIAKRATLNLLVAGKNYECYFYFSSELTGKASIVLGQAGFFDKNKVTFNAKEGKIIIE